MLVLADFGFSKVIRKALNPFEYSLKIGHVPKSLQIQVGSMNFPS